MSLCVLKRTQGDRLSDDDEGDIGDAPPGAAPLPDAAENGDDGIRADARVAIAVCIKTMLSCIHEAPLTCRGFDAQKDNTEH